MFLIVTARAKVIGLLNSRQICPRLGNRIKIVDPDIDPLKDFLQTLFMRTGVAFNAGGNRLYTSSNSGGRSFATASSPKSSSAEMIFGGSSMPRPKFSGSTRIDSSGDRMITFIGASIWL